VKHHPELWSLGTGHLHFNKLKGGADARFGFIGIETILHGCVA
jgi:hypothetical protein